MSDYARLYESHIASGTNVGDVTPGTQSWRFVSATGEEIAINKSRNKEKEEKS